ncbi:hydroxypyruvate isomerase family protein [Alloalcanivorax mobilis]|uniref:hydroxypyruvate isomerase family protein n=1 Tax=Alloalcanivorax mobilis TaxID=2019569 RepID=UPI000B5B2B04|nr:hydroxypyruvate isomerase family protein [Alloalcanivorax mobilis]ASK34085.1 hydroxypyruvate isomerase [Alcanivorax sp. N3-2A]|tara:strand:+ start:2252 stop:3049 length:798 start_codon:yes stop_codon:yes gene_type:complete
MPRFAANLSLLFTELPFLERFAAARAAGFDGVECLFPYQWPAPRIAECLREQGLQQVLFNLPAGDWRAGERGLAGLPGREAEFRDGVGLALEYAAALDCPRLNCLAGIPDAGVDQSQAWATLERNVADAADRLAQQGRVLTLEPINSRVDMPGFLLDTAAKAMTLIERLQRPNLRLQYDLYHMWIMGEDLLPSLAVHCPHIEHVQFADAPGRHQPGSGEIPLSDAFALLDELGYAGWASAEYRPLGGTTESLHWLAANHGAAGRS